MFKEALQHVVHQQHSAPSHPQDQLTLLRDHLTQLNNDYSKNQIEEAYEEQQNVQMDLKYKLVAIQQLSNETWQEFRRLKNKRANIEQVMDSVTSMLSLKNTLPLLQGAIQNSNLQEAYRLLTVLQGLKPSLIQEAAQHHLQELDSLSQQLQKLSDSLLQNAVARNDIDLIGQCSMISDALQQGQPSVFLRNLQKIYQDKVREDLKEIYVELQQSTIEQMRAEAEEEEEGLVFAGRFDEVLQRVGRILRAIGANSSIQSGEVMFALFCSVLDQELLRSVFDSLCHFLKQFYSDHTEDAFLEEMAHVSFQVYNLFDHMLQLLRAQPDCPASPALLTQYESLRLLQTNQENLILYIKNEEQSLRHKLITAISAQAYSTRVSQQILSHHPTSKQRLYQCLDVVDVFYLARQSLKRALSTRSPMAGSALINHVSRIFSGEFYQQASAIVHKNIELKVFQSAMGGTSKGAYQEHLNMILGDMYTVEEYLDKLYNQVVDEYSSLCAVAPSPDDMVLVCIKELQSSNKTLWAGLLSESVLNLAACLRHQLSPGLDHIKTLDLKMRQEELYEKEGRSQAGDKLTKLAKTVLKPWENLRRPLFDRLLSCLFEKLFNDLITIVLSLRCNLIGAIYLDKEVRHIVSFFQSYQRHKVFARINTLCVVLMQENKEELLQMAEVYKDDLALDSTQLHRLLSLRTDL